MKMMTPQTLALEQWLPDAVVIDDLKRVLYADSPVVVELESGDVLIPLECEFEVVSKAFIEQRFDVRWGTCFRAIVAIGNVTRVEYGTIQAKYCFSTLWYNHERKLITTDFSKESFG